jgi:hypothetical protein
MGPPKLYMNIVDQVRLRGVTIWTILTKMSFFLICVTHIVLEVACWFVLMVSDSLSLQVLFLSFLETFVQLVVVLHCQTRNLQFF